MFEPALVCELEAFARRAQKLLQATPTRVPTETCAGDEIRHTLLVGRRIAARTSNARAPLCTFHADVLHSILLKLTLVDRIAFSQTCHALRVSSLALGDLWTSQSLNLAQLNLDSFYATGYRDWKRELRARDAALLAAQLLLLQRASPAPVRLDLVIDMSPHLLRLLDTWMHCIEVLKLQLFDWRVSDCEPPLDHPEDVLPASVDSTVDSSLGIEFPSRSHPHIRSMTLLNRALGVPAPRLKMISLSMPWPRPLTAARVAHRVELRRDVFAGVASSTLLQFTLQGLALPVGGCPALSQLTFFNWDPQHMYNVPVSDLDDILHSMPLLHTLGLTVPPSSDHYDVADSAPAHVHLRHVAIRLNGHAGGNEMQNIDALLGYFFSSSHAAEFVIRTDCSGWENRQYDAKNLAHPDGLEIVGSWLVLRIGRRTFRVHKRNTAAVLVMFLRPETFARLAWCAVDTQLPTASPRVSVFPPVAAYPRAAVLTTLYVLLRACAVCGEGSFESALGGWSLHPWECPALQTLHFVRAPETALSDSTAPHVTRCAEACVISAEDVRDFVQECLIISRPRLLRLTFTGFRLYLGMLALRAVAETVTFDAEFPTNLCGHRIPQGMRYGDELTAFFEPPIWTPDPRDTLLSPAEPTI